MQHGMLSEPRNMKRTLVTGPGGICQFLRLRLEDHRFKGAERDSKPARVAEQHHAS